MKNKIIKEEIKEKLLELINTHGKFENQFTHFDKDMNEVECDCPNKPRCEIRMMNFAYNKARSFWVNNLRTILECKYEYSTGTNNPDVKKYY